MEVLFFMFIIWFFSYAFIEIMNLSEYRNDLYYGDTNFNKDMRKVFYFDFVSTLSIINIFKNHEDIQISVKIASVIIMPLIAIAYAALWVMDRV